MGTNKTEGQLSMGDFVRRYLTIIMMLVFSSIWAAGTTAGLEILALSTNIGVSFSDGGGTITSKNASEDSIIDWAESVVAIHGLVPGQILCDVSSNFTAEDHGPYRNVEADRDIVFRFAYTNRSNEAVTADVAAILKQNGSRWSVTDNLPVNMAEDALVNFVVTVNSGTAIAFQYVTLNVTASIVETPSTLNVVSYNAFANATGKGGIENTVYGGENDIFNYYVLQAVGYNISIKSRTAAIFSPDSYVASGGGPNDPVPGAKVLYTIAVKNNSTSKATSLNIKDVIPANCHLFFNDTPVIAGDADSWTAANDGFTPNVNTAGGGTKVSFNGVNIDGGQTITLNYTVTID